MRISPSELTELYRCPKCGAGLNSLKCCECDMQFESMGDVPVLVDFSTSVLSRAETLARGGASPIARAETRKKAHPQVAANLAQLSNLLTPSSRLLVIGGGEDAHGLWALTDRTDLSTIVFDIYASPLTDFLADAHRIPLADDAVDCVVIQAVLEHVLDPWRVVEEIYRVLRPGGLVYAETPFMQQVHEGAYDFTRFTESGHRWLFRKFDMIESGAIGGPITVLTWTNDYLLRALGIPRKLRGAFRRVLTWLTRWDGGLIRRIHADSASAVYFLGRKVSDYPGLSPAGIIAFYSRRDGVALNKD